MKKKINLAFIYPLLLALYPIIFLYAHNLSEVTFNDIFPYIALSFLFFLIVFILFKSVIKNIERTGFITAVFFLIFFSYGFVFDFISSFFFVRQFVLLPIWGCLFLGIFYWIFKSSKKEIFAKIGKILTVVFSILIFINLIQILPYEFSRYSKDDSQNRVTYSERSKTSTDPEKYCDKNKCYDIYYIILDEYAGFDSIKSIFGYDNSNFLKFLNDRNFIFAKNSKAKSPDTFENISSNLNMENLKPADKIEAYKYIGDNKVSAYLKGKGYTTVVFNNSYLPDNMTANADYNLMANKSNQVNSVLLVLINKTMLRPLVPYIKKWSETENRRLFILRELKDLDYIKSPKFVYVHLVCPHPPFQFDKDGNLVDTQNAYNWTDKKYYLGQYIFITKEIQKVIDVLQKKDAIIIVQSDHGVRQNHFDETGEMQHYSYIPEKAFENILSAFYLPEFKDSIPDNLKSFNTFKIILNYYFGENLEIL
ncbi:MAG: hypothetical protein WCX95_01540 [Candidatus Gracilibacteria bacterium]